MKGIVGIFIAIMACGALASASERAESDGKDQVMPILSFYQWMDLPKAKREAYIAGLQLIMKDWEARGREAGVQAAAAEPMDVQESLWALLLSVKPARAADPASCAQVRFAYSKGMVCADPGDDLGMTCYQGNRYEELAKQCPQKFNQFADEQEGKLAGGKLAAFQGIRTRLFPPPSPAEVEKARAEPAAAAQTRCGSVGVQCAMQEDGAPSIDDLRKKYREAMGKLPADKRRCAVGGFVSTLNSKKKCTPVRKWTIGSWSGQCDGSETMCNPMVFGFKSDGKPFCAALTQSVTTQCWTHVQKEGNTSQKIAEQLMGKSDATKDMSIDDLADRWREFREGLTMLCEPGPSLEFHCSECGAMDVQIRQMNMASTCSDNCGRVPAGSEAACRTTFKAGKGGAPAGGGVGGGR